MRQKLISGASYLCVIIWIVLFFVLGYDFKTSIPFFILGGLFYYLNVFVESRKK